MPRPPQAKREYGARVTKVFGELLRSGRFGLLEVADAAGVAPRVIDCASARAETAATRPAASRMDDAKLTFIAYPFRNGRVDRDHRSNLVDCGRYARHIGESVDHRTAPGSRSRAGKFKPRRSRMLN